jgi:hypothetical protein
VITVYMLFIKFPRNSISIVHLLSFKDRERDLTHISCMGSSQRPKIVGKLTRCYQSQEQVRFILSSTHSVMPGHGNRNELYTIANRKLEPSHELL